MIVVLKLLKNSHYILIKIILVIYCYCVVYISNREQNIKLFSGLNGELCFENG